MEKFNSKPFQIFTGCMSQHGFFVHKNGKIFAFGSNTRGKCGVGKTPKTIAGNYLKDEDLAREFLSTPCEVVEVPYEIGVLKITMGYEHSIFLLEDFTIWVVGSNYYGQMLNSDKDVYEVKDIPKKAKLNFTPVDIYSGENNVFLKSKSGKLFAVGEGDCGQLGVGNPVKEKVISLVRLKEEIYSMDSGTNSSIFLTKNGNFYKAGGSYSSEGFFIPVLVKGIVGKKISGFASGNSVSLIATAHNEIYGLHDDEDKVFEVSKNFKFKFTHFFCGYNYISVVFDRYVVVGAHIDDIKREIKKIQKNPDDVLSLFSEILNAETSGSDKLYKSKSKIIQANGGSYHYLLTTKFDIQKGNTSGGNRRFFFKGCNDIIHMIKRSKHYGNKEIENFRKKMKELSNSNVFSDVKILFTNN